MKKLFVRVVLFFVVLFLSYELSPLGTDVIGDELLLFVLFKLNDIFEFYQQKG